MKWALYALGTFVALIVLVFLIGSLLAQQHTATRAARFHQSPETIWGVITDYSKFPEWRKNVTRVEPLPAVNGQPSWREFDKYNRAVPYEIVEWTPPRRCSTRIAIPICRSQEPGHLSLLRKRMAAPRCALLKTARSTMSSFVSWLDFSSDTQPPWKII
jgi:Polyketide cyclase / dehydrase and lipid transport